MNQGKERTGTFLRLPYDFRKPTLKRFKQRLWNPDEPRVIVPHAFGWGYTLNLRALLRRARIMR